MLQILLFRPGSTEYDQQGRVQGTLDIPLSEDGRRQVEDAVDEVRRHVVDAIYCGPDQSARQTANSLGEALRIKPRTLDQMKNLDLGLWQGMLIADVRKKQPKVYRQWQEQPETVCPPQGETIQAARERVANSLSKMSKKHRSGVVAMVVPEPLAAIVRHVLREDTLNDLWNLDKNGSLWELIDVSTAKTS